MQSQEVSGQDISSCHFLDNAYKVFGTTFELKTSISIDYH